MTPFGKTDKTVFINNVIFMSETGQKPHVSGLGHLFAETGQNVTVISKTGHNQVSGDTVVWNHRSIHQNLMILWKTDDFRGFHILTGERLGCDTVLTRDTTSDTVKTRVFSYLLHFQI